MTTLTKEAYEFMVGTFNHAGINKYNFLLKISSPSKRSQISTILLNTAHIYLGFDNQYTMFDKLNSTYILDSKGIGIGYRLNNNNSIPFEFLTGYKKVFQTDANSLYLSPQIDNPKIVSLFDQPEGLEILKKNNDFPPPTGKDVVLIYSYGHVYIDEVCISISAFDILTERRFKIKHKDYNLIYQHLKYMNSLLISKNKLYFKNNELNIFAYLPIKEM